LPLRSEGLAERATTVHASPDLSALAQRLERLLGSVLDRPLYLPAAKALLSRDGGVCEVDGARLRFDPLEPYRHACPACGRVHEGERHHRAWIWRYHLWLSERAIHLALVGGLQNESAMLVRSREILEGYAALHPTVPNRDNVLGPTRLFFSTYLESIWLLQTVIAASLLEAASRERSGEPFDAMVRESAGLIASFDEGWSNRQVWNNAALLAAGQWLGDELLARRALDGPHGIRNQLLRGVGGEGLWYEGENYHFFALRGFLLAAELARASGTDLYGDVRVGPRLSAMYVAPLETLLPDLTLPARGDAPFGVSVMQQRFAELWEIGRARVDDRRLGSLLADLYGRSAPEGEDAGPIDIAEQEMNRPAQRITRDRLSWKALCWMLPDAPAESPTQWTASSRFLGDAGVAVLRPAPDRYVSLECGGRPGGHGHPDLLHVTLHAGGPRLADFGTGSYVSPSLHWYRSTAAHNAPGVRGQGQARRDGACTAFGSDGTWLWCRGQADDLFGAGTSAERSLVVGPAYVLDVVDVTLSSAAEVELPIHPLAGVRAVDPDGSDTLPAEGTTLRADRFRLGERPNSPELLLVCREGETIRVGLAPAPPSLEFADGPSLAFLVRLARGSGRWVQLYSWEAGALSEASVRGNEVRVVLSGGEEHTVRFAAAEVVVEGREGVLAELSRGVEPSPRHDEPRSRPAVPPSLWCPLVAEVPAPDEWERVVPREAVHTLGAMHYRRSEVPYAESLGARVAVFASGMRLCFAVRVWKPALHFRAPGAPDPRLDNEPPDIHSDGIQCYVGLEGWTGLVAVPDPEAPRVRLRAVAGSAKKAATAAWCPTEDGYSIVVAIDVGWPIEPGEQFSVQLVVNEMYAERERRAGQLALSGGPGWVYLRGDRESSLGAIVAEVS